MSDKKCFSAVKARPGAAVIIIAALLLVFSLSGCGETYYAAITGDRASGYRAVFDER